MDDVYFNKNKRNGDNENKHYDLPPINEMPFENSEPQGSFTPPANYDNRTDVDFTLYPAAEQENNYAPYTGKTNNRKNSIKRDGYAPYRGKQKKNREKADTFEANPIFYSVPQPSAIAEPQQPKKKKKSKLRTIAVTILCVFTVSFIGVFMLIAASGYTKTKLEKNTYVSQSDLRSSPFVRNILLIGVDGTSSDTALRSDSMILVSIDSVHSKIKISSFMRDSWVEIPGYKYAKLNAACSHGGPQLVVDTIEYNFGVDIEDYVLVNFTMFTNIIDAIGGVDVEVTEKEASFINKTTRYTVESGDDVHLNGAEALVYCRIRKLDSDYMRTYRQRKVIKAILKEAKGAGAIKLIAAMRDVLPMVETDMGPIKLTCLFYRGVFSALFYKIQSTRIPTDDLSWYGTEGSQSVVELDVEKNAEHLQRFIYTNEVQTEEETQ